MPRHDDRYLTYYVLDLEIGDKNTTISKDGSDNLTFEDVNAGAITLTELKSMRNVWIKALAQSPGNLSLSDGTNWDTDYSYISSIKVVTASTNWSAWLCEDNSFSKTALETRQVAAGRNGDYDITVAREYNPGDGNVYLIYQDDSGSNNADIYVVGVARRH